MIDNIRDSVCIKIINGVFSIYMLIIMIYVMVDFTNQTVNIDEQTKIVYNCNITDIIEACPTLKLYGTVNMNKKNINFQIYEKYPYSPECINKYENYKETLQVNCYNVDGFVYTEYFANSKRSEYQKWVWLYAGYFIMLLILLIILTILWVYNI